MQDMKPKMASKTDRDVVVVILLISSLIMQVEAKPNNQNEKFDKDAMELKLKVPLRVAFRRGSWSESESASSGSRLFLNSHQNVGQSDNYINRPYRRPSYQPYDDAEDLHESYNRPRYPDYRPYDSPYYYPQPYPYPPTTTTTTTTTQDPRQPIGYMLLDTYRTPLGTQIRPLAYYKV